MGDKLTQDEIFLNKEGDNWFSRNKEYLNNEVDSLDTPLVWIQKLLNSIPEANSVIELGCSNGWRLNKILELSEKELEVVGVEASKEAIKNGKDQNKNIEFVHSVLHELNLEKKFDIVLINYVLHWVDRKNLAKTAAVIDGLVKNSGYLIIGDFLPDFPQKRIYHHLPDEDVFTYKQDYGKIFESLETYQSILKTTYNHDNPGEELKGVDSKVRGHCNLLYKSLENFYLEV